jgi:hypothetical protein
MASIAKPDVGVILNIGTMHIDRMGSMEGILKAKLEIVEGMEPGAQIFLNGDDALLWNLRLVEDKEITFFGIRNGDCHILGKDITESPGMLRFWACCQDQAFPVELALEGRHYVHDALAAIGVGLVLDVSVDQIQPLYPQPCRLLVEKQARSEVSTRLELCENVQAPVEQGQILGRLQVYVGDELRTTIPLTAAEAIPRLTPGEIMLRLMQQLLMAK